MNDHIEITKEMMLSARDYVPLAEKEAWCADNAPKCFDKLAIKADNDPLPPMYMVNAGLKSRYLMAALARLYFGADLKSHPAAAQAPSDQDEGNDEWLMTEEEYDRWAGSHVFNQIERWKRDTDVKAKAYDLMFDYKDLEKRFSTQISGLLMVQNDPVIRQIDLTAANMKDLPAMIEELNALQKKQSEEFAK